MKDASIILMDKAHMKVYNIHKTHKGKKTIELLDDIENLEAMQKIGEKLSDQAGRFKEGNGENHNIKAEEERKLLKAAVNYIHSHVQNLDKLNWFFAADKSIHNKVLEKLDKGIASSMLQSIPVNLINEDKQSIMDRFEF